MKKKSGSDIQANDLNLLALLVAKRLRTEHCVEKAPGAGDFRIADSKTFFRAGREVQVDVDLGRGLKVVVFDAWWHDREADLDALLRSTESIANKFAETARDADLTRRMFAEVTAAAKCAIAKGRRRGMPYELTSVTLPALQVDAHDQTVVRVEHLALGRSLRLEPFAFEAECADDVLRAFEGIAEEQARRTTRRAELDEIGATGTIDSVVVAALGAAGVDLPQVLTTLRDSEDWIADVDVAEDKRFCLHWEDGAVHAQITLGDGGVSWHQGRLWFGKAERTSKRLPKGSPLSRLYDHPFLNERIRILKDYSPKTGNSFVSCNEAMLNFDADSGRLWTA